MSKKIKSEESFERVPLNKFRYNLGYDKDGNRKTVGFEIATDLAELIEEFLDYLRDKNEGVVYEDHEERPTLPNFLAWLKQRGR